MDANYLDKFRNILIAKGHLVSKLEYTTDNYDNQGNLIIDRLPTLTTDYCEIGVHNDELYFVFIIKSKSFNDKLFSSIKNMNNLWIYGFEDFKQNLYPKTDFNHKIFLTQVDEDEFLQIQFDYKNIDLNELYTNYCKLIDIFNETKIVVVNQLNVKFDN